MQGHCHPCTFSRLAGVLEMDKGEGIQRGPLKRHRVLLRREWEHIDQRAFSKTVGERGGDTLGCF